MKPLIGAAPLVDPERDSLWMLPGYFNLIKECGGSPIMIDPVFDEDVASRLDGILITGGQDVNPELFGRKPTEKTGAPSKELDDLEYALLDYALAHRIPVFGICRGIQIINVYFGGTLTDDLPSERPGIEHHQAHPYDLPTHPVRLFGKLKDLLGTDHLEVNTLHHQAADKLGKGLVLEAEAPDGTPEAVSGTDDKQYLRAVQWHPETLWVHQEEQLVLVRDFIRAAKERQSARKG